MKILHTADWHIGQLFHEYDRTYEHQQFLTLLLDTLAPEHIGLLLISGDVLDLSNPSAASIKVLSALLAQGDFTAFLKADRQKTDPFGKLTEIRIYSEISRQIFVHYSREKRALQTIGQ